MNSLATIPDDSAQVTGRPTILDYTGPGTPEQRSKFIGGSDVAAIMGLSKWATPLSLWEKKTGRIVEEIDAAKEKIFARGKRWEQTAFEMLIDELEARGHKIELVAGNRRYQDAEYDFLACEIDREIRLDGQPEIVNVEIKTVHVFAASEWGNLGDEGELTDEIPIYYATQAMHGLGVTQRKKCIVGALFGADNIVPYIIERDDETIAAMREKCVDFWVFNVLGDKAPDPINMEDISRLFAKYNGRPAEIDEDAAIAFGNLLSIRSRISTLNAEKETQEFLIADAIRRAWNLLPSTEPIDNAEIRYNGAVIGTWKKQSRESIDTKLLRAEYPEAANKTSRLSWFRVFRKKSPK